MATYLSKDLVVDEEKFNTAAQDMRALKERTNKLKEKLSTMYEELAGAMDTEAGHEPHLILRKVQMCKSVIKKSGKQLIVCYPTFVFFESNSLSIFLFVPLCIESIIAFLYSARSNGEVKSSTSSSQSKGFLLFGFFRL